MKSKEAMQALQVTRDEFYYLVNVKKQIEIIDETGKCYEYSDKDISMLCGVIKHRRKPRKPLTERPCIVCGQLFIPPIKYFNNPAYKGICCSRQCGATYRKERGDFSGENNSAWCGNKIKRVCLVCGKGFMVKPSDIKRGYGKFCSRSCTIIHTHKSGKFNISPNKPESTLIDLFKKHELPFKYTGGGDVWIGKHNPDFININGQKQVIELFGDYWHPTSDVPQWIEHYKEYGFTCLVVWEHELSNMDDVLTKIKAYGYD